MAEPTGGVSEEHGGEPDGLATIEDAQRFLKVCRQTVYTLMESGELPSVKIGRKARRIRWSHLRELAEKGTKS